jgi:hypothetical protein
MIMIYKIIVIELKELLPFRAEPTNGWARKLRSCWCYHWILVGISLIVLSKILNKIKTNNKHCYGGGDERPAIMLKTQRLLSSGSLSHAL